MAGDSERTKHVLMYLLTVLSRFLPFSADGEAATEEAGSAGSPYCLD